LNVGTVWQAQMSEGSEFQVVADVMVRVLEQSAAGRQMTVGAGQEQPSGSGCSGMLASRTMTP